MFFKILINLSAVTEFPSLCFEYISMSFFLFGLWLDSSKIFWKPLVIVILFLSFKGITHAYMLWISITHNKNLNPLSNLLIFPSVYVCNACLPVRCLRWTEYCERILYGIRYSELPVIPISSVLVKPQRCIFLFWTLFDTCPYCYRHISLYVSSFISLIFWKNDVVFRPSCGKIVYFSPTIFWKSLENESLVFITNPV